MKEDYDKEMEFLRSLGFHPFIDPKTPDKVTFPVAEALDFNALCMRLGIEAPDWGEIVDL